MRRVASSAKDTSIYTRIQTLGLYICCPGGGLLGFGLGSCDDALKLVSLFGLITNLFVLGTRRRVYIYIEYVWRKSRQEIMER